MRKHVSVERRTLSRLAVAVAVASLAAACSDATRFAGGGAALSPPAGIGRGGSARAVASLPATPRTAVHSQPLAPPAPRQAAVPFQTQPYTPPKIAAAAPSSPRQAAGPGGWTAQGGTPVMIAAGENLNVVANRYGVPASAILSANGLSSAAQVTGGRRFCGDEYETSFLDLES